MRIGRFLMIAVVAAFAVLPVLSRADAAVSNRGHVYLLRGLGNIFSLGMDRLASDLNKQGIATTTINHLGWHGLADQIIAQREHGDKGRIVIIGHSLGANAALRLAERLGEEKIRVALVVTYDPTAHLAASPNVDRVLNYDAGGAMVDREKGFKGKLENVDVRGQPHMSHVSVDESEKLRIVTIAAVKRALGTH